MQELLMVQRCINTMTYRKNTIYFEIPRVSALYTHIVKNCHCYDSLRPCAPKVGLFVLTVFASIIKDIASPSCPIYIFCKRLLSFCMQVIFSIATSFFFSWKLWLHCNKWKLHSKESVTIVDNTTETMASAQITVNINHRWWCCDHLITLMWKYVSLIYWRSRSLRLSSTKLEICKT